MGRDPVGGGGGDAQNTQKTLSTSKLVILWFHFVLDCENK